MKRYAIFTFFALLIMVIQMPAMEDPEINTISDPVILRKNIFDITEILLNGKIDSGKRTELNNKLALIYECLIELHQVKDNTKLDREIAIKEAKDFCYGVIDDIKNDTQEKESCFRRDNYFAYQTARARLYEIQYKLKQKDTKVPSNVKNDLKQARKLLHEKTLLYLERMRQQKITLEMEWKKREDSIYFVQQQTSNDLVNQPLKKATKKFQRIQKTLNNREMDPVLLTRLRRSRKKIKNLEQKDELNKLYSDDESDLNEKLQELNDDIQRIKTSLQYLENDIKNAIKTRQDIIEINFLQKD